MPINTKDPIDAKNYQFGKDLFIELSFILKYFGKKPPTYRRITRVNSWCWSLRTKPWSMRWTSVSYISCHISDYEMSTNIEGFLLKALNVKT